MQSKISAVTLNASAFDIRRMEKIQAKVETKSENVFILLTVPLLNVWRSLTE